MYHATWDYFSIYTENIQISRAVTTYFHNLDFHQPVKQSVKWLYYEPVNNKVHQPRIDYTLFKPNRVTDKVTPPD